MKRILLALSAAVMAPRLGAAAGEGAPPGPWPTSAPALESWLGENPHARDALLWPSLGGSQAYEDWPPARKAALADYFLRAWNEEPSALDDPPRNLLELGDEDEVGQVLSEEDAEKLYLATAGQVLAADAGRRLPWSLRDYSPNELSMLLDGAQMVHPEARGFRLNESASGRILPPPPDKAHEFMRGLLGPTRLETILALLEWVRRNAVHYEGAFRAKNVEDQWRYRGFPPALRVIEGTIHSGRAGAGRRSRLAGCHGTAGFLMAMLRTVNIPVRILKRCGHSLPSFPSEGKALSHGDDLYNQVSRRSACPVERLLLDAPTFEAWFDEGPREARCANIGRGALGLKALPCHER